MRATCWRLAVWNNDLSRNLHCVIPNSKLYSNCQSCFIQFIHFDQRFRCFLRVLVCVMYLTVILWLFSSMYSWADVHRIVISSTFVVLDFIEEKLHEFQFLMGYFFYHAHIHILIAAPFPNLEFCWTVWLHIINSQRSLFAHRYIDIAVLNHFQHYLNSEPKMESQQNRQKYKPFETKQTIKLKSFCF